MSISNNVLGVLFYTSTHNGNDGHTWLQDVWVFDHDCSLEALTFQEEETSDARWVTSDIIKNMMTTGEFLNESFYPYFNETIEKWV